MAAMPPYRDRSKNKAAYRENRPEKAIQATVDRAAPVRTSRKEKRWSGMDR